MARILMIVSAADSITLTDGTVHPTGFWAEELAVSHQILREAGVDVDIVTPGGAAPTVDPVSLDERGGVPEKEAGEFRSYLDSIASELTEPGPLAEARLDDYDALFIPGGHGPMVDLAQDADAGRLLTGADAQGKIIAVLCHGPAALLSATREDGGLVFAGRRITTFTDEEENSGGLGEKCPYFLETRLRERGAVVDAGPAWQSKVVVDGNLISGQNPQSSAGTAHQVLTALHAGAVNVKA